MKKTQTMKVALMLVLVCSISTIAQTTISSDTATKKDQMMMSIAGCLAEKDGKYMMMNKEHPDGLQLMTSEDMKAHVGNMMKVSGMMEHMSMPANTAKSDDTSSGDKMKNMGMMKVNTMKMLSEHCDMSSRMKK